MTQQVVRALINAHITPTVQLHEGDIWIADDPIVRAHPEWFSEDLAAVANRTTPVTVVEDASADPGTRRTTGTAGTARKSA